MQWISNKILFATDSLESDSGALVEGIHGPESRQENEGPSTRHDLFQVFSLHTIP